MQFEFKQTAFIEYTRDILENGRVVKSFPPKRNLLLDSGLNLVAANGWVPMFSVCALGSGTTPTKRDSGSITFTRSGNRVTASESFFQDADLNRLLKFDSGEEMYIRAIVSTTQVDVDSSGDLPGSEGTVWYVEQTKLDSQTKTMAVGSGLEHGTTFDSATGLVRHRRTFLGAVETANIVYREIGWSNSTANPSPLLGRDLIPGGGDSLAPNQQYRVRVDLYIDFGPKTPVATPELFPEWPGSAGMAKLERIVCEQVSSTGGVSGQATPLNPSNISYLEGRTGFISTSNAGFPTTAFNTTTGFAVSGAAYAVTGVASAYVAGSRKRSVSFVFGGAASDGVRLDGIRSFGWGTGNLTGTQTTVYSVFRVLMDNAQYKDPWWKLTITLVISWGRVLVN